MSRPLIQPINEYDITCFQSVYDEEAFTSLELAGRTAARVNECVKACNMMTEIINEFTAWYAKVSPILEKIIEQYPVTEETT